MTPLPDGFALIVLTREGETVDGYTVHAQRAVTLDPTGEPATLLLLEATDPACPDDLRWAVGLVTLTVPEVVVGRALPDGPAARARFAARAAAQAAPAPRSGPFGVRAVSDPAPGGIGAPEGAGGYW
jgi:hypothetical protein